MAAYKIERFSQDGTPTALIDVGANRPSPYLASTPVPIARRPGGVARKDAEGRIIYGPICTPARYFVREGTDLVEIDFTPPRI